MCGSLEAAVSSCTAQAALSEPGQVHDEFAADLSFLNLFRWGLS